MDEKGFLICYSKARCTHKYLIIFAIEVIVQFFPQMKPEKWDTGPDLEAFKSCGIPEAWIEHIYNAGYNNIDSLKEAKNTAIHQKLNGFRKKNKLDIPALQLEEIESWLA